MQVIQESLIPDSKMVEVYIKAVESGQDSNLIVGQKINAINPIVNTEQQAEVMKIVVAGRDEESDNDYRQRGINWIQNYSYMIGTKKNIEKLLKDFTYINEVFFKTNYLNSGYLAIFVDGSITISSTQKNEISTKIDNTFSFGIIYKILIPIVVYITITITIKSGLKLDDTEQYNVNQVIIDFCTNTIEVGDNINMASLKTYLSGQLASTYSKIDTINTNQIITQANQVIKVSNVIFN